MLVLRKAVLGGRIGSHKSLPPAGTAAAAETDDKNDEDGDDGSGKQVDSCSGSANREDSSLSPPPPPPPPQQQQRRQEPPESVQAKTESAEINEPDGCCPPATGPMKENEILESKDERGVGAAAVGDAGEGGGEEEGAERRREQLADVDRHMASLYIAMLERKSHERGTAGREEAGAEVEQVG